MAKEKSKPVRWAEACEAATAAIDDLISLQEEYQEWLDNMPDGLQEGATHEKLEAVCDVDFQNLNDEIGVAFNMDLPLGFGRD